MHLYEFYGDASAVGEALRVLRRAVAAEARGTIGDRVLGALGAALTSHYEVTGNIAALDEAVAVIPAVVARGALDPALINDYRANLAVTLETRAKVTGHVADANAAVALLREALASPADAATEQLLRRSNLANALLTRRREVLRQLDEVITRTRALSGLANFLRVR